MSTSKRAGRDDEQGEPRIAAAAMLDFAAEAFRACGLPTADAAVVAGAVIEADLTGSDAHGMFRLAQYVRWLREGRINPRPNLQVIKGGPAAAIVDGDNGMGHLVMSFAANTAVEMARETGVAWVGTRYSNHAGSAGVYAEVPLRAGMIGIYAAVANANHMAIWGGSETLLGTNPIAFAIPAGEEPPIVLDIATTIVSYGTIKAHALEGRDLPEGWMVNRSDGTPLTDPRRSAEGILLPLGGYKGSGLALMIGLLGGVLNGATFGREVIDYNYNMDGVTNTGQFVIALDVARFMPLDVFKREVDRHIRDLKGSAVLPGHDAIRLPGERRRQCQVERTRDGVPVPAPLLKQLDDLANDLGIAKVARL
jgi:L-2-hydroxycarboxylate dehydrogenase (NAD+)